MNKIFLWTLALTLACAVWYATRAMSQSIDVPIQIDREHNTVTLPLPWFMGIVEAHNAMVDEIQKLRERTGCI